MASPSTGSSRGEPSALRRVADAGARLCYRLGFRLVKASWWITRPTLRGVYVAVWHEGRVLLIRNSYHPRYSFPSGRCGRGERPVDAAVRELREEVGIAVGPDRLELAVEMRLAFSRMTDHVHLFELHLAREPVLAPDRREVIWAGFEDPELARHRRLLPAVARYLRGETDAVAVRKR